MAAVLLQSVGQLCGSFCECLKFPFSLCGSACSLCGTACGEFTSILCSPFSPYVMVTYGLNIPPLVWGLKSMMAAVDKEACGVDKTWYLWVNALLALSHLIGSIYIVYRIQREQENSSLDDAIYGGVSGANGQQPSRAAGKIEEGSNYHQMGSYPAKQEPSTAFGKSLVNTIAGLKSPRTNTTAVDGTQQEVDDSPPSSFQRLGQVLCYDAGVAIYLLFAITWAFWQSVGISVVISTAGKDYGGDDGFDYSDECGAIRSWIGMSIMCGFVYMTVVACAFGCSLLCLRQ